MLSFAIPDRSGWRHLPPGNHNSSVVDLVTVTLRVVTSVHRLPLRYISLVLRPSAFRAQGDFDWIRHCVTHATGGKKVSQYRILSKMSLFEALYLLPVDSNMTHSFCSAHTTICATLLRFHQLQNMRCNGRYPGLKLAISEDGKTPCCSPFQWLLTVFASNEAQWHA